MPLINVNDLKIGMKIGKNVYNKDGVLLLEQNIKLKTEKQIDILKTAGIKFINASKPNGNDTNTDIEHLVKNPTEHAIADISAKIEEARQQINKVMNLTGEVFNKIIDEKKINKELGKQTRKIVGDFIDDIEANQEIYASLEEIKEKDVNLLNHSVQVCTNALLMGMGRQKSREELMNLGTAAIMHDIGKIKIDNRLISKMGRLDAKEMAEMKKHPAYSEYYINKMGNMDRKVIEMVLKHHEQFDGGGYPYGIKLKDENSLILAISNQYNNYISTSDISMRVSPAIALRKLRDKIDKNFSKDIYILLLNSVGFYPVGSLVQLNNGDLGKVMMQNKDDPGHPKVLIKFDKYRKPKTKLIDTSLKTRAGAASKYLHEIVKVIDSK